MGVKSAGKGKGKANLPATAEGDGRNVTEAEAQEIIGRNAGKSGALFHSALAAKLLANFAPGGKLDQQHVTDGMKESAAALVTGNMETVERMLHAQMITLNAVFASCVSRSQRSEYMPPMETYMRLGLKAQAQCSRTAEILGNLRAGPTIFTKQANVTTGPQQVNNGTVPGARSRAQETPKSENELLEDNRYGQQQRMVPGAQGTPAPRDPAMEAVGEIHRPKDEGR